MRPLCWETNASLSGPCPVLLRVLDDEEPIVRGAAAWALGEIGGDLVHRRR